MIMFGINLIKGEELNDMYGTSFKRNDPSTSETINEIQPSITAVIDMSIFRFVTKVKRNPIVKINTIRYKPEDNSSLISTSTILPYKLTTDMGIILFFKEIPINLYPTLKIENVSKKAPKIKSDKTNSPLFLQI